MPEAPGAASAPEAPPAACKVAEMLLQRSDASVAASKSAEVSRRDALGAPPDMLAYTPSGFSPQQQGEEIKDFKPLHFKDIPEPAKYGGASQGWLNWSTTFRRFMASREPPWRPFLEAIETLRGNAVTEEDGESLEKELGLKPNIGAWKDQLNTQLVGKFVSGSAELVVSQCGVPNACEAWRILAEAGCSTRPDAMMGFLAKLMQPKRTVADKDFQGYFIEWEKELALYHRLSGKRALDEGQYKTHLMNMCSSPSTEA